MANANDWIHPDNQREAEIRYLVEHTDISPLQARDLVAEHGPDREKLLAIARTMKAEG